MKRLTKKMESGLATSVFPGAVLLVAHKKKIVYHQAFGYRMILPEQHEMTCDTIFDLASLTKPLVTAAAAALLIQKNQMALEDPVHKFLPGFSGQNKSQVTLFHLLNHSSGLPAWKAYYEKIAAQDQQETGYIGSNKAKQAIYEMASKEPLLARPGEKSAYSDIGFILLGAIIEKIAQTPLDQYFEQHIRPALTSRDSFFMPLEENPRTSKNHVFAATENPLWRKELIQGRVHDDNAFAMGGIAGHAGLFAKASDVYSLVLLWCDALQEDTTPLFDPKIARLFTTRQHAPYSPAESSWALGWDTPSRPTGADGPGLSSSGHFFSPESFGHLGYTGTSIWVDLKNDLIVIFLSNRVHPNRTNESIRRFRPELHDMIFKEVIHG